MSAALDLSEDCDHTYIFVPDTAADLADGEIAGYMECTECCATREVEREDAIELRARADEATRELAAEMRADELRFVLLDIARSPSIYR